MSISGREQRAGAAMMLLCAAMWSTGGIFIKLLPWNSLVIAGLRSLIAGLTVYGYMRWKRIPIRIDRRSLLGGGFMCLTFLLFVGANKRTTAANAIVLQFTAPVFILLYSGILFHKRFARRDVLAVAFTLGGIVLFFLDQMAPGKLLGNFLGIGAGMTMGAMYLAIGSARGAERMSCVLLGQLFTAVVGLPFLFVYDTPFTAGRGVVIVLLGVVQLGVPYMLYAAASARCPPLACSLLGAVEPLLNPVWVFLFDGETPGLFALAGGVVVVATIMIWCLKSPAGAEANAA